MGVVDLAVKTCTSCGTEKPLSEFHRQHNAPDGLRSDCKPCAREVARRWQQSERERMGDEAWRAYRAENVRRSRRNPSIRARGRLQAQAYAAAQKRLRELHQSEFEAIYAQERYERGL